jgi:formylglycine-generating enzyme required for sulfatase activity
VLIPAGPARLGGDPLASESDELVITDVGAFVLQRFPVTFGQWSVFIEDLRKRDAALAALHAPKTRIEPASPEWPVYGVSAESAEAYARWLADKEGRAWRLPTEQEWEKAARGTDGRIYPWGDHFDATFCKMRDSRHGQPHAEPIGTFAWDVSPYGVRDLAGGVADWCIPDPRRTAPREPREVVSRGGAWCDWAIDCRLASRRRYLATEHAARVGVRLARDP